MPAPIAMTLGDPSGVGPEIALKSWASIGSDIPFFVIGDTTLLTDLGRSMGIDVRIIKSPQEVSEGSFCVIAQDFKDVPRPGELQLANASGTIEAIERAVSFVKSGEALAVVTNPINKMVLVEGASFAHPGHTEFLAELDGKDASVMMLATPDLRVVPVTIHIPLKDVSKSLTPGLMQDTIETVAASLVTDFGIKTPRIAVAGLNPHAGEGGVLGVEEIAFIAPVLEDLRSKGMNIRGPMSADTMFHARARAEYDVAICMYHDQALIPIKTIDFDRGVNVTLGLSFVRTSPDHGTAYDIAGKGLANPTSLIEAVKMAHTMGLNRVNA